MLPSPDPFSGRFQLWISGNDCWLFRTPYYICNTNLQCSLYRWCGKMRFLLLAAAAIAPAVEAAATLRFSCSELVVERLDP